MTWYLSVKWSLKCQCLFFRCLSSKCLKHWISKLTHQDVCRQGTCRCYSGTLWCQRLQHCQAEKSDKSFEIPLRFKHSLATSSVVSGQQNGTRRLSCVSKLLKSKLTVILCACTFVMQQNILFLHYILLTLLLVFHSSFLKWFPHVFCLF